MSYKAILPGICALFLSSVLTASPDEGMFPLSELNKLDLKKAGLRINQTDLYNPNGISLIDALVNVGGCTGSFVSSEGLIITNHHCAFSAVQQASTPEKDYLTNGFVAGKHELEIEAKGLTCRITESYEDVSDKIAAALAPISDPAERVNKLNATIAALVKEAEAQSKGIKAEVSEMFIGRTYVLFRYRTIQDVRLVYIPKRNVGEFGGESDNWVWPRHTGDFSFMRAYVAPDGSSAKFAKENIPYQPKKFLKINPKGISENDLVFILGYPGRTFRNRPAAYLTYQQRYILPYISNLYTWQNQQMEETGLNNKADELRQASRIKSKANVLKNYQGKLKGLKGTGLIAQKEKEEKQMDSFIQAQPELKAKYGNLLNDINQLYTEIMSDAQRDLLLGQFYGASNVVSIANQVAAVKKKLQNLEGDARDSYFKEASARLQTNAAPLYAAYVAETDIRLLANMLETAAALPNNQRITAIDQLGNTGNWRTIAQNLLTNSPLSNEAFLKAELQKNAADFYTQEDPLMAFIKKLNQQVDDLNSIKQNRDGRLNQLMGAYTEVKMAFMKTNFIPDANSTLRFTYGYVKGGNPSDATYYKPFTSVKGIIEKGLLGGEYHYPPEIKERFDQRDFGQFKKSDLDDVPVAFLYNLDTTGGNSGSPVMNADGELVGVNFDRSYEATINDYAWNANYSRSIGVDIRYVLWVAQKIDKADFILKELGVNTKK